MSSTEAYRYFDFSDVFTRTKEFIDGYNILHPELTEKLNANHRATAELIIRLYLKQLNSISDKFVIEEAEWPGFKTYNSSLATCKGCTSRTIMNHKERLKKAGFIIKEEHRGAQGIELWVNPAVLLTAKSAENSESDFLKIQPKSTSTSEKRKNFHPLVHEPHEQRNNNSAVDRVKGVLPHKRDHESGLDKSETTGTRHEPYKNTEENDDSASNKKNNSSEVDHIFLQLVMNFWTFARKILYPDLILSDPEERDIMNRIWSLVYNRFGGSRSKQEWFNYHEQALERVVMVRKWLDRSPNHWIPRPDIYFSPHNENNGFQKTLQWLVKREVLKLEVRQQLELQKVRHEQKLHNEGKGRHQHLNRLQLFRLHEQRLRRYNDPQMLEAYYVSLKNRRAP